MDVSVIIVNYNTKALLYDCILSIDKQTRGLNYEIIVVDNASADNSREMVKTNFPDVVLIESEINLGFGKANNLGAQIAKGQFVFLLNSDTILINNAIKILFDYISQHSKTGICGSNLYTRDLNPATSFSQNMPGFFADTDYFFGGLFSRIKHGRNLNFNYTDKPMVINGFISGADMMISKDVFLEVKGFDPDFFMYYEDTELTYRIRKKKLQIVSVPDAKIIHLEGASELIKENSEARSFNSKFKYYAKTGMKNRAFLSHISFIMIGTQRIVIFYILRKKKKVSYWKSLVRLETEAYKSLQ